MKIFVAVAAAALVAVLAVSATVGAGALVPGGGSAKKKPRGITAKGGNARVTPVGGLPFAIKGTGFVPGENVKVTMLEAGPTVTRRVKASRKGTFLVRFAGGYDRCNGMRVRAVGDRGSKTSFQLAQVMCAAPGAAS